MRIAEQITQLRQDFVDVKQAGYTEGYEQGIADGGNGVDFEKLQTFILAFFGGSLTEITEEDVLFICPTGSYINKQYAFSHLIHLTKVTFPYWENNGTGKINFGYGNTFTGCTALKTFETKGSLFISSDCFKGCTKLSSFNVALNLDMNGNAQFGSCTSLTDFYVGGNITITKNYSLGVSSSPLTKASILNILEKVVAITDGETRTIQLGTTNLAKLTTAEDLELLDNVRHVKGYTVI